MTACIGYDAASRYPCHRQATEVVAAGCEHEHIAERAVCDWHAGDIREGSMKCGDCADSASPHDCWLTPMANAENRREG